MTVMVFPFCGIASCGRNLVASHGLSEKEYNEIERLATSPQAPLAAVRDSGIPSPQKISTMLSQLQTIQKRKSNTHPPYL